MSSDSAHSLVCARCNDTRELLVFSGSREDVPGGHHLAFEKSVYIKKGGKYIPCPYCMKVLPDSLKADGFDLANFTSDWGPFAEAMSSEHPPQIPMAGGIAASSPCPPFHLIPTIGLIGLAERFQKGIDRKGDKAWNAMSSNQACLKDKEFAIERISHVIDHATKLRDKLRARDVAGMAEDDDAGAIAWAGIFLYCVVDGLKKESSKHEGNIGQ